MSKHKDIIDAVKTTIDALASPPTSVIRDRLVIQETDLTGLPKIVLTMGSETDGPHTLAGDQFREYEVLISIVYAQNQTLQSGIDDAKGKRELIRAALTPGPATSMPLLGVTGVWDCDVTNLPGQDQRLAEAGYERADLRAVFKCAE